MGDVSDPLAQFQHTTVNDEQEMLKLVKTLNNATGEDKRPDTQIERSFGKWWPDLNQALRDLPPDESAKNPKREPHELLAELIDLARVNNVQLSEIQDQFENLQAQVTDLTHVTIPASSLSSSFYFDSAAAARMSADDGSSNVPPAQQPSNLAALRAAPKELAERISKIKEARKKREK